MILTKHAAKRLQQRGIPPLIVEWLEEFGSLDYSHGATRRFLDNAARKRLAQKVGREVIDRMGDLLNAYLVEHDGVLITAGRRTNRLRRR